MGFHPYKIAEMKARKEIDFTLLELARYWIDRIFRIGPKNDETASFLEYGIEYLS